MRERLKIWVTLTLLFCVIFSAASPVILSPAMAARGKRSSGLIYLTIALSATISVGLVSFSSGCKRLLSPSSIVLVSPDLISLTSARLC